MSVSRSPSTASTSAVAQSGRLVQLDALRGLAALAVVFCHFFEVFPSLFRLIEFHVDYKPLWLLCLPPVYLAYAGHTAVLFFFLLSGFVLAIPFLEPKGEAWGPRAYGVYVARRLCRIYLPYVVCIVTAMLLACVVPHNPLHGLTGFMERMWSQTPTPKVVAEHLLLVGQFDNAAYNGVIWTLCFEMRISIVFPVIALLVLRLGAVQSLVAAMLLALAGVMLTWAATGNFDLQGHLFTLYYAAIFMFGAILAKHRHRLVAYVQTLGRPATAGLWALALLLTSAEAVNFIGRKAVLSHPLEMVVIAGASLMMILALTSSWLTLAPLVWLGRTSYSVYLWHMPVLLTTLHLGYGRVSLWVLLPLAFVGSFVVGHVMHKLVEQPAAELSRRLGRRPRPVPAAEPTLGAVSPA